jgi:hypothetical protein
MGCPHTRQKYVEDDGWRCRSCGEPVVSRSEGHGILRLIQSGGRPMVDVEPEGHFSFSRGQYVKSRRHAKEIDEFLGDPERNEDHVMRPTPVWKQRWMDRCREEGVVPGTPESERLA